MTRGGYFLQRSGARRGDRRQSRLVRTGGPGHQCRHLDEGMGSIMPDPVTLILSPVPQCADARVDIANGVLICTTSDEGHLYELTQHGFPRGVYHSLDYPFYCFNSRANAQNRVNKYLSL